MALTSLEICTGAGGQALGLEQAGFEHVGTVEIDAHACQTLRKNRPQWNTIQADLREWDGHRYAGVDLLAGGVPCPPFSLAGKQLGAVDERDLFPQALRLVDQVQPRVVMLENVRGLLDAKFSSYRAWVDEELQRLGYQARWKLLQASDYGVPQLRPRVILLASRIRDTALVPFPEPFDTAPPTVGECLVDLMGENGWQGATDWARQASVIAPTLVGGSKKHGGADLGPTRARRAWAAIGVDGRSLADEAPGPDFTGMPRLTLRMTARIQGFPDQWQFAGGKTASYRQIGNALPPAVAKAVGEEIAAVLQGAKEESAA
ncbi:DNA cytosine methyltransferase [Schaalia suimastitidis]|uniref:DNA cytosine methyltransferase n=1 Tax=Schaalia suimastitidis TaxID=121163 RepID=UPI0003F81A97|nr:DNA cytosine methyltransferase [Schaalia suimastitidis]